MDWESHAKGCSSLQLSEPEYRYYNDIFVYCCKNLDCDQVPSTKVGELLRSASLPVDVVIKILDISGAAKYNTLNRKQFFAVLKLVAAHQAGIEVHKDLILTQLDDISLPKFQWPSSDEGDKKRKCFDKKSKIRSNNHMPESTTESDSEAESPHETEGGSTDSPTPTNSVNQERNEAIMRGDENLDSITSGWQSLLVSEEQRQLLGTEEESSERHSSDDGEEQSGDSQCLNVWAITDEQREYYNTQFAQMQPNPEGLLSGSIARKYFEKSRLPVEELRKIWQLADVTRDSALSLQEFYVAMHLTVIRKHHLQLPDVLPSSLAKEVASQKAAILSVVPPIPAPRGSPPKSQKERNKEWTKFVDSPTGNNNSGSLTSPGPKPVNFDFQKAAVERDPKILHPVPLRLTPEAAILASNANGANGGVPPLLGEEDLQITATSLIQRPLAKKPLPLPEETVIATPKKEPPPPPPPRPYRTHTRSSSLDLNKLGKNGQNFPGAPPLIPPRVSPGITTNRKLVGQKSEGEGTRLSNNLDEGGFVADFSQFTSKAEENKIGDNNAPSSEQFSGVCGAFHIYKKPTTRKRDDEASKDESDASKLTLQELREINAELRQVCEELTAEWASALQERINLKAKLLLLT